mmetsp:Transcript_16877/g.34065  ORF Transcript_16877/g.34065 Transcript_16877/m.34065 type:complete len:93 (-) Transcript_16877:1061-1339(-)
MHLRYTIYFHTVAVLVLEEEVLEVLEVQEEEDFTVPSCVWPAWEEEEEEEDLAAVTVLVEKCTCVNPRPHDAKFVKIVHKMYIEGVRSASSW